MNDPSGQTMPAIPSLGDGVQPEPESADLGRLRDLLVALVRQTGDGILAWELDDAHPDSYCCSGPGWLCAIRSTDGDGIHPFELVLEEPTGHVFRISSKSALGRSLGDRFEILHLYAQASAMLQSDLIASALRDLTATPPATTGKRQRRRREPGSQCS